MSKIRSDYEQTAWRRFLRWVNGNSKSKLQDAMEQVQEKEDVFEKDTAETDFWEEDLKKKAVSVFEAYEDWPEKHGVKIFRRIYTILSMLICVVIITFLLYVANGLPSFGEADNPANNEVAERYLEDGLEETGAVNLVAGVFWTIVLLIRWVNRMCCLLLFAV